MELINERVVIKNGEPIVDSNGDKNKTLAYKILSAHHKDNNDDLFHITFDSLTSHDITYVSIIQTARASGLKKFSVPYVLTNCHNSLCAIGGTINEDDHQFALSCAHKYGGIYVPANLAVIHSYNREMMTKCGGMILGSDSHTRYGALGTLAIGEGGGELAKQLLRKTYDIKKPEVVLVYLTGKVKPGIGPHDVALSIVKETYKNAFVKNAIMEFAGPGIKELSQDFRDGIDVMTTETTCLSSIWETDDITKDYYLKHNRLDDYKELKIEDGALYDRCLKIDLDKIESMIALPSHPSYALPINELKKDPYKYLKEAEDRIGKPNALTSKIKDGQIHVDQAVIAGCSGGIYENIVEATSILKDGDIGNEEFRLSIYPDSLPMYKALVDNGQVSSLLKQGIIVREAFCGPCFGAGETPANNELSIRHTTRNFPNREGSKPSENQNALVALMDARSIAATARNKGVLTPASDVVNDYIKVPEYKFDTSIYEKRIYNGFNKAQEDYEIIFGPNIKDWPPLPKLSKNLLIKIVSHIDDEVTSTDELIPSGETSSYRSNPLRLAEFTLSRRDPGYVNRAKEVAKLTKESKEIQELTKVLNVDLDNTNIVSSIYARNPGDGSAREQAASCQRVLMAGANIANSYATKRYRSNLINWGMIPFLCDDGSLFELNTYVYIPDIYNLLGKQDNIKAFVIKDGKVENTTLHIGSLLKEEVDILKAGCLINYYKEN